MTRPGRTGRGDRVIAGRPAKHRAAAPVEMFPHTPDGDRGAGRVGT